MQTAGYLFSNSDLREELANAKDADAAGKILAKHLQKDGKQLGEHVKKVAQSDDLQKNLKKAQAYAKKQLKDANAQIKSLVKDGKFFAKKKTGTAHHAPKKGAKKAA